MWRAFFWILFCCHFKIAFANTTLKWISIPAGTYKPLFTPSEADPKGLINLSENRRQKKIVTVDVAQFEILQTPVTNEEFLSFIKKNPEWRRDRVQSIFADKRYLEHWISAINVGRQSLFKQPVANVSWFAAQAYCEFQDGRLPSNDEWEFIASQDDPARRDETILNWYAKPNQSNTNTSKDVFVGKHGVRDMYGKIWEWTMDFNSAFVTGESREDTSLSRAMFCGAGSIGSTNPSEYATFMRFAFRTSLKGNYALPALGFRCVRNVRSL